MSKSLAREHRASDNWLQQLLESIDGKIDKNGENLKEIDERLRNVEHRVNNGITRRGEETKKNVEALLVKQAELERQLADQKIQEQMQADRNARVIKVLGLAASVAAVIVAIVRYVW